MVALIHLKSLDHAEQQIYQLDPPESTRFYIEHVFFINTTEQEIVDAGFFQTRLCGVILWFFMVVVITNNRPMRTSQSLRVGLNLAITIAGYYCLGFPQRLSN